MKKKLSPLPQAEPEVPDERPASSFAEARRRARSILGLDEGEARIESAPPVATKVVTRNGRQVRKWRYEADAKKRGDWPNDHPLQIAFEQESKKFNATVNKIKRQARLGADGAKGADRNRAKGQATKAIVLDLADQPRIAALGRNMAARIAMEANVSESQVRRILAERKARMTEK